MNKKRWVKKRHSVVFSLLRPIFKLHFKCKYNFKGVPCEKQVPSPALVMCNHTTTLDPFMVATSFKRPMYFITSDDLCTIPIISPIIRWLVAIIPKSKSKSDFNTIRYTLQVLKEGGTVVIFPEGNRSLSGGNWVIEPSTAKFAKMCKVPLVLYNIKGGYGADPRWGNGVRRGKMQGEVVKIIQPEQLEKMSTQEIYDQICSTLISNDYNSGVKFKSKRRAEYLERAIYYCENCGSFNTMRSEKDKLYCKICNFKAEYTEDLQLKPIDGKCLGVNVKEWFDKQKQLLLEYSQTKEGVLFGDDGVKLRLIYDGKRHKLGKANMRAEKNGVEFSLKKDKTLNVDFESLYGSTVLGKRKINFYLSDGKTLQVKGSKRFNSIKYLHLYEIYKEGK